MTPATQPDGAAGNEAAGTAAQHAFGGDLWGSVWARIAAEVATFPGAVRELPVVPDVTPEALRAWLTAAYPFDAPVPLDRATADVMRHLRAGSCT